MGRLILALALCASAVSGGVAAAHPNAVPHRHSRALLDLKLLPVAALSKGKGTTVTTAMATQMVPKETTQYVRVRGARAAPQRWKGAQEQAPLLPRLNWSQISVLGSPAPSGAPSAAAPAGAYPIRRRQLPSSGSWRRTCSWRGGACAPPPGHRLLPPGGPPHCAAASCPTAGDHLP